MPLAPPDSIELQATRNDALLDPTVFADVRETLGDTATIEAVFHSQAVPDSDVRITCAATDAFDNRAELHADVAIDNSSGAVIVAAPSDGATVSGTAITVRCACEDLQTTCALQEPSPDIASVPCGDPVDGSLECVWNTTLSSVDGHRSVSCVGTNEAGSVVAHAEVLVDNLQPWRGDRGRWPEHARSVI